MSRHALHTCALPCGGALRDTLARGGGGGEGKGAASHLREPSVFGEAGSPTTSHRSPLVTPTHPLTPAWAARQPCKRVMCARLLYSGAYLLLAGGGGAGTVDVGAPRGPVNASSAGIALGVNGGPAPQSACGIQGNCESQLQQQVCVDIHVCLHV